MVRSRTLDVARSSVDAVAESAEEVCWGSLVNAVVSGEAQAGTAAWYNSLADDGMYKIERHGSMALGAAASALNRIEET